MALHAHIDSGSADYWNEVDAPEYACASFTVSYWDDDFDFGAFTEADFETAEAAGAYFHCEGFIGIDNGLVIDADRTPLGLCEEHAARLAWRDSGDALRSIHAELLTRVCADAY